MMDARRRITATALAALTATTLTPLSGTTAHAATERPTLHAGDKIFTHSTLSAEAGTPNSVCTLTGVLDPKHAVTAAHCAPKNTYRVTLPGHPNLWMTPKVYYPHRDIVILTIPDGIDPGVPDTFVDVDDRGDRLEEGDPVHKIGATTGRTDGNVQHYGAADARVTNSERADDDGLPGWVRLHLADDRGGWPAHGVQTSVKVKGGDSGAPLLDSRGRVHGVLTTGDESGSFYVSL